MKFLQIILIGFIAALILALACRPATKPDDDIMRCDSAQVTQIVLIQSADTTRLSRDTQDRFWVNNNQPADTSIVRRLLALPYRLMIKMPVSKSENDSLSAALKNKGLEIVYRSKSKSLCRWYLGEYSSHYKASPFMNATGSLVFWLELPSGEFQTDNYYRIKPEFYYDRRILDLQYYEISSVKLQYFGSDSLNSFRLSVFPDSAAIIDYSGKLLPNINLKAVGQYLNYFADLRYYKSNIDLSTAEKDSLLETKPLFKLQVEDTKFHPTILSFYPLTDKKGNVHPHLTYTLINDSALRISKYYEFDLLCKSAEYFIE